MRILVANDDGINANGIKALVKALKPLGEITVFAPHQQQTAKGHSVTYLTPIKVRKKQFLKDVTGYEVWGTPRDCVDLALMGGLMEKPDLVVSGINEGPNLAGDCICSGTIAAATVAYLHGIPALAVSLDFGPTYEYKEAAKLAYKVADWFSKQSFNTRFILNLNIPNTDEIKGVVTALPDGRHFWRSNFISQQQGDYLYFKRHGGGYEEKKLKNDLQHELYALKEGYAVMAPLDDDVIDYRSYELLKESWCQK